MKYVIMQYESKEEVIMTKKCNNHRPNWRCEEEIFDRTCANKTHTNKARIQLKLSNHLSLHQPDKFNTRLDFSRRYTIANTRFRSNQIILKCEVATSNGLGGDTFTRKCIISLLTLTFGQGQTRNVAQYPLHHMTFAPAKFEAAMSNGLGGTAFTRNI